MLSNAYFLAKFRFDTAENEPAKKLQNFANLNFPNFANPNSTLSSRLKERKLRVPQYYFFSFCPSSIFGGRESDRGSVKKILEEYGCLIGDVK